MHKLFAFAAAIFLVFGCVSSQQQAEPISNASNQTPASASADVNGCLGLPAAASDACLSNIAFQTKNASICAAESAPSREMDCFARLADSRSAAACSQFGAGALTERTFCYSAVAMKRGDLGVCDGIALAGFDLDAAKSFCAALAAQDVLLCGEVNDSSYSGLCISLLAAAKRDASLCSMALGDFHNPCIISVAAARNDSSICETSGFTGRDPLAARSMCLGEVAAASGDGTICAKITDSLQRDGCYCKVALATKSSSWSDKINSTGVKKMCGNVTVVQIQTH